MRLTVLHTPGHTPGGICLFAEGMPRAGHRTCSRATRCSPAASAEPTSPGASSRALSTSIARQLVVLPAETIVHPGHGPDTTIGRERKVNPFFPRA